MALGAPRVVPDQSRIPVTPVRTPPLAARTLACCVEGVERARSAVTTPLLHWCVHNDTGYVPAPASNVGNTNLQPDVSHPRTGGGECCPFSAVFRGWKHCWQSSRNGRCDTNVNVNHLHHGATLCIYAHQYKHIVYVMTNRTHCVVQVFQRVYSEYHLALFLLYGGFYAVANVRVAVCDTTPHPHLFVFVPID